jgi:hypothetical protein
MMPWWLRHFVMIALSQRRFGHSMCARDSKELFYVEDAHNVLLETCVNLCYNPGAVISMLMTVRTPGLTAVSGLALRYGT